MSFVKSRLRRAESAVRNGPASLGQCPECGLSPGAGGRVVYAGAEIPEDPQERCARCGRRLWFVIEVGGRGSSLMPRCAGMKRDGGRCAAIVDGSFCYQHDPTRADERSRNASKAARSRPSRELAKIKTRLSDLADGVLAGGVDKGVAAVASQVLNVYLRAVSVELKAREQLELIERLEALEEALERQTKPGGSRRGYA